MNKFLILQILISIFSLVSCQHHQQSHQKHKREDSYPQYYPIHTQYSLQQHHPTSHPTAATITQQPNHHHNHYFQSTTASSYVDLDKFNQHAKAALKSVNYFNQQEQKNLRQHINSVHQEGSEPHFDFLVSSNYSDLEKASEQFVSLGSMAAKQNMPKVIKITKTVAVKQPVPVPYPVPFVKVIKEQMPAEYSQTYTHQHNSYAATPTTPAPVTEKPYDFKPSPFFSNYTSYINKYPENTSAHKIAESYIKQELFSTVQTATGPAVEYDTRPFYVRTSDKEMIKYVPVPFYIDEEGNRHEIKTSSSPSSSSYETSNNHQESEAYYNKQAEENAGKFSSYSFSYHPPTPRASPTSPTPSYHYGAKPTHPTPETSKYYYSHDNIVSPSSPTVQQHYVSASSDQQYESGIEATDDEHQHYQYKYVYERRR